MAGTQDMSSRCIFGGGSQLSKTKSNSDSFSFNLPADILLIVHDFLPATSQLCLLTTCRGIKVLLEHRTVPYSRLNLEQKREYKTIVIRQFPNAWLDEDTLRFREFLEEDLYPQPQGPPFKGQSGWDVDNLWRFKIGALLIRHRHVRMSLIYHRLEKKTRRQKSFLKSLLEPYHTDFSPCLEIHPSEKSGVVGHFESHPRLVSGRYLLFNQYTFTNTLRGGTITLRGGTITLRGGTIAPHKFDYFGVCKHQVMSDYDWKCFLRWGRGFFDEGDDLYECVREAIKNPELQADGMCPHCLTEFSICMATKRMQIRVWKDLGTEDSCWNPVWQTHLGIINRRGHRSKDCLEDCLEIRSRYGDTGVEGQ